ncbi:methyl-accepting chemotaxis protein [Crassaminicella profunda]|uniref:methyl-accepting chemotaxis protein n=1 Tax=Crassaminicella profunda TaxID=1286698 RepID=UPI001CA68CE7|nr:methyl-accepting chemotaxis protein [Crassaminicella profunda]QZY54741.1 methyl-accepting chemotaxis protein [Crassaminicella profunda]
MKRGIRFKLVISFILLITIPMAAVGINCFKNSVQIMKDEFKEGTSTTIEEVGNRVDTYLEELEKNIKIFSTDANVEQIFSNADAVEWMVENFGNYCKNHPDIISVYIGTKDKKLYAYPIETDLDENYDPTTRDWYKDAISKNTFVWSEPYEDKDTKKMVITISKPVYDSRHGNEFVGVVAIDISLDQLSKSINNVKIGKKGYIFLTDEGGNILTHPNKDLLGKPIPMEALATAVKQKNTDMVDYVEKEEGINQEKFSVFTTLDRVGWNLIGNMYVDEIHDQYKSLLDSTLIIGAIALVLAILIAIFLSGSITKNLRILSMDMEKIKEGDLTVHCQINTKDEVGALAESFNTMKIGLRTLLNEVSKASREVGHYAQTLASSSEETSASSDEIASAVDEIAKGATKQAIQAQNGSSMVGALASKLENLEKDANGMMDSSQMVLKANEKGIQTVNLLKDRTKLNNEGIEKIVKVVGELDVHSQNIGSILETISTIAEQTNLLALNAAIEAARAGDAGSGFAVVAEEIRKLAEESKKSAEEIKEMTLSIQDHTHATVDIMNEVKLRNTEQVMAVDEVNVSFEEIVQAIEIIGNKIETISGYIKNMNQDGQNIVSAIENISGISEETAASSEQVSASMEQQSATVEEVAGISEKLNGLAVKLNDQLNQFKI